MWNYLFLLVGLCTIPALAAKPRKDYLVTLRTNFGVMHLILYDQTPKHKENFIKLVEQKFYDSLLFHRIIANFMIQGGDPNSKNVTADQLVGKGDVGYQIPAEIQPSLFHKKGALAAARDNNPEKASSGCQFYIVHGRIWDDEGLEKQLARSGRTLTESQKQVYKTLGGTPHLDGNYTVFGEVIDGLEVVDTIASQANNEASRPKQDIRMVISGEWVKKKKIAKRFGYNY